MGSRWLAAAAVLALGACRWGFQEHGTDANGDTGAGIDAATPQIEICTTHWCWERPPPPEQRTLRAIDGSSATNVWAVGDGGVIRHWDGTSWHFPQLPTTDALSAVDVASDTDITIAAGAGVLWHFDGSTWTQSTLASKSSVATFWRSTDNKLWAAGDVGTISIDGVAAPGLPTSDAATAIDGNSTTNVWYTGVFNRLARWNGSSWSSMLISDFPTAVVAQGTIAFVGGANLWSCDTAFTCTQLLANVYVRDFFRVSDSDIWAVGSMGFIEHYTGGSWQMVTSPSTTNLTAIWGSSTNDIWAAGEQGTLLHYDGASWSITSGGTSSDELWVALWVGADDDRWMGFGDGTMWHSDGGAPVQVALPSGSQVGDEMEGNAQNDVYARDSGNLGVLHFDGTTWSRDPSLSTLSPNGGGLATNPSETLASNLSGNIYREPAGGTFSPEYTSAGTEWHGLCYAANGDALAVGRFGSGALRTSGVWAVNDPPTARFMIACSFAGTTAWAVGGDTVVELAGGAWSDLGTTTKTRQILTDVLAVSTTEVYVATSRGRIVRFDGVSWAEEESPIATDIQRFSRGASGTIFAVAHSPGMLRRR